MKYWLRMTFATFYSLALSCTPPAPAPPETGKKKPGTSSPSGAMAPVQGTATQIGTGSMGAGTIGAGSSINLPPPTQASPAGGNGSLTTGMSAISSLIGTIQGGGDFNAIFGSVTNLISAFTGGSGGGGTLSGFGNLLGSLIGGQPTVASPTSNPTQVR
ncbi:MAG: hypothetical protein FJ146_02965 [Deltaproteobacteria bacterium]|nr:hypothetical protein [Deltaproteobacteria bacterium]